MEIENDLRAEQKFVGGRIAIYPVTDDFVLIHNDDGLNDGMQPRAVVLGEGEDDVIDLRGIREIIHGDCFICKVHGDCFASIKNNDVKIIKHHVKKVAKACGSVIEIKK